MSELTDRLAAQGADMHAALERLAGDEALYDRCFRMFWDDPAFPDLESALRRGDYAAAFNAAHTLKGAAGNLGLSPLYARICELVESLRSRDYSDLKTQYQAILSSKRRAQDLLS